jgi:hypothetical protein
MPQFCFHSTAHLPRTEHGRALVRPNLSLRHWLINYLRCVGHDRWRPAWSRARVPRGWQEHYLGAGAPAAEPTPPAACRQLIAPKGPRERFCGATQRTAP